MREICLHLLDIAENSVAAQASSITIRVEEDLVADRLAASVQDDGRGMDAENLARAVDPFCTSRTTRKVGLGIPLLKAAAEACNGGLTLDSQVGKGSRLSVSFQHSHIDRMPLGDLPGTWLNLLVAHPETGWRFEYSLRHSPDCPVELFIFDDRPVKEALAGLPLSEPAVLGYLRQLLQDGVADAQYHRIIARY